MKRRNFLLSLPLIGLAAKALAYLKPKDPVGGLIENINQDGHVFYLSNPSPPSWVKEYAQVKTDDLHKETFETGADINKYSLTSKLPWFKPGDPIIGALKWEDDSKSKVIFVEDKS